MKESAMRQRVVRALRPLDAFSVENCVRAGTPDVNFTDGWIELKQVAKRPVRSTTTVRLPHFTPQQRVFLRKRWHVGGKAFVLLLLEGEWFLFDGCWAARCLGDVTYATLKTSALRYWLTGLNETELLESVVNESPNTTPCGCTQKVSTVQPTTRAQEVYP